jgi:hypothetical protein
MPFALLLIYFVYSFFFTTGSVRLFILLYGHPIDAYTTNFTYYNHSDDKNVQYLMPTKNIKISGGYMEYIKCKNYGFIKISTYYGF